ncbi:rho GTPase-activating protein 4 isoform X2 [Tachyglossus aculeatus]|uniref:rho GTPase-activating protein 4 isoform X2 n=1 Tax=Tachyglossus aculeatus TaxID=9261 RepID=UPI0018F2D53C|nr:rho GTPase-activating protein 4 isoform X2 [Tachyglossus aculeatus]
MASHGKLRKERGPLAEYETQVKEIRSQLGEQLRCLEVQGDLRRELLQDLGEFLRRRAEVELEYSRGLERLADRFSSRARGNKELQSFRKDQNLLSPVHCWYVLLNQTRQESRDHGVLSELYGTSLTQRLLHISEDVGRLVKKSKDLEQQLQEELLKVVSELQTAMKTYQAYRAESVNAENKLREAERQEEKRGGKSSEPGTASGQGPDAKTPRRTSLKKVGRLVEKRQAKYLEHKLKCTKARNEYLLSLASVNAAVSNYYVHDVSDLLDCCDVGFHLALGKVLKSYVAAETRAQMSRIQGLAVLEGAVEGLDPLGDKAKVLEFNATAFCPPLRFDYQPYDGDEVGEVRVELELRAEVLPRAQNMQTRLDTQNIETEEVNKTLKATLQALLDLVAPEDGDVLDAFQSSQSTESLKSTGSDSGSRHGGGGRRRAQQQETESFYLTKLQEYLSGRSVLTKLQAKHERLQEAIQRGVKEEREVSRAHSGAGKSQRSRRQRPSSQYNHKLFAGDMEKFIQSSGQAVPLVVESCIRFINLHGLQHEGIFRVPGAQVRVTEIRSAFERGEDPLLDGYTAHDLDSVAGVLKLYFRGLETPLFPPEMFEDLLATVQLEALAERVEHVKTMMSQLPSPILVVLRYLFAFLNHLSQYSDENMMDPYNLAVCFGPTLVSVPPDQDPVAVQAHVNEVVKTLILQQEHVFPGPRQLPGPIYEKCMTLAEEDFGDSQLEPTVEEGEQELQSETPGSEDESEVVEATARFDYVGRTAQELSFQRGDVLQLHIKASGDWWRGERAGVRGLIPHKYITLPEGAEKRLAARGPRVEGDLTPAPEEPSLEPTSRLRVNSDGSCVSGRSRVGSSSPLRKLTSPFLEPGRLAFPLAQPTPPRTFVPIDRPSQGTHERRNTLEMGGSSGAGLLFAGRGPSADRSVGAPEKQLEVDKDITKTMNYVFKELMEKTSLRPTGAEDPPASPESPQPGAPGKKGSGLPRSSFGLRSKGLFKATGGNGAQD